MTVCLIPLMTTMSSQLWPIPYKFLFISENSNKKYLNFIANFFFFQLNFFLLSDYLI